VNERRRDPAPRIVPWLLVWDAAGLRHCFGYESRYGCVFRLSDGAHGDSLSCSDARRRDGLGGLQCLVRRRHSGGAHDGACRSLASSDVQDRRDSWSTSVCNPSIVTERHASTY
jgi:hypothetical protein